MPNFLQQAIDNFWQRTIFFFLPSFVRPNHFTFLRLLLTPVVWYALFTHRFAWGFFWFLLAILADSLDGSLARKRQQITTAGIVLDPLADKLLVVSTILILAYYYPYRYLILGVVFLDLLMGLGSLAYILFFPRAKIQQANWPGKFKLFFQATGVLGIFCSLIFANNFWLDFSAVFILLAIGAALISLLDYLWQAIIVKK